MWKSILLHKLRKLDWFIILIVLLINGIGLLSLYSQHQTGEHFSFFERQALFTLFGIILMFLFTFFDYRVFRENSYLVFFLYIACLISLAGIFIFAPQIRGVRSWYKIGPFSLDPTEFSKVILIILFAKYFSQRHVEMYRFYHIIFSGLYLFFPVILVYLQPDLGSVLIFILIWLGILVTSGIRIKHFLILCFVGILLCVFAWHFVLKGYQKERIISFLFPEYKPLETGWSQRQAKIALGNGGLFGKGFGKGSQVHHGFLPEPHTDFIFAAIGEEFGFITLFMLLSLYLLLLWRISKIAFQAKDNFARLFAAGVGFWLFFQLLINVGSNIGLLPIIGLPLPFVSYGGSSLIVLYITMGLLESIKLHSFQ